MDYKRKYEESELNFKNWKGRERKKNFERAFSVYELLDKIKPEIPPGKRKYIKQIKKILHCYIVTEQKNYIQVTIPSKKKKGG